MQFNFQVLWKIPQKLFITHIELPCLIKWIIMKRSIIVTIASSKVEKPKELYFKNQEMYQKYIQWKHNCQTK